MNYRSQVHRKVWLSFEEARNWARSQNLGAESDWRRRRQEGLPPGIPTNPNRTYVEHWEGWGDFLGTGTLHASQRTYRTYEQASQWARAVGLTRQREWRQACAAGIVPEDIPRSPWRHYSEWTNFPAFFGQDGRRAKYRKWRAIEAAQAWVRGAKIYTKDDWFAAAARGAIPDDIPINPGVVYPGWKGWPAFLGRTVRGGASLTEDVIAHELSHFTTVAFATRSIALPDGRRKRVDIVLPKQRVIVEYDGAHWHRRTVEKDTRDNGLLAATGWRVIRLRELPMHPISPDDVVVDPAWPLVHKTVVLLRRLLGAGLLPDISALDIDRYEAAETLFAASTDLAKVTGWRSFEETMGWVLTTGVTSESQWRELRRSVGLPRDIPSNPDLVYSVSWRGWGHFFGTGVRAVSSADLVDYETAKAWARQSGIRQAREWSHANKIGLLPRGIPGKPDKVYQSTWEGWGPFLGVSDDRRRRRNWKNFEDARSWARQIGVDSETGWRKLVRANLLPQDIPRSPAVMYREEWRGWGDWLGTGNEKHGSVEWLPFEEARGLARSLRIRTMDDWLAAHDAGRIPTKIPKYPSGVYKGAFLGWRDWLGRSPVTRNTIEEMRTIAESRGGRCLSPEYLGLHKKLLWECSRHHKWMAAPSNVIHRSSWCKKCWQDNRRK